MIDLEARGKKEAESLFKKMKDFAKKNHVHLGYCDLSKAGRIWSITMETSNSGFKYGFVSDMEDIVSKSKFAIIDEMEDHKGTFDWASDTYIKPVSIIHFKI
jgi:hypothetical protein